MIPAADRRGPWTDYLDDAERRARFTLGPRGDGLADLLRSAEQEPAALGPALAALDALAPTDRRRVPASFVEPHRTR